MIRSNIANFAKKNGKSITDIARETGLNRNTVTALFHNKVDGIKFSTVDKICQTYQCQLSDILIEDVEPRQQAQGEIRKPYRQEGEIIPFTCWSWMIPATTDNGTKYFKGSLGPLDFVGKKDYGEAYWDADAFSTFARDMYEKYKHPAALKPLYRDFQVTSAEMESFYMASDANEILNFSPDNIVSYHRQLWDIYQRFWETSLFVDAFDAGFDKKTIDTIASKYKFTPKELVILTTPDEMAFVTEKHYELLKLVTIVQKYVPNGERKKIKNFLEQSSEFKTYQKKFGYYASNYVYLKHISLDETVDGIQKYISDTNAFEHEWDELYGYAKRQQAERTKVLKKYKLKENPLYFFERITFWREQRKKCNLMGIHLQHAILHALEHQTGIKYEYLWFLSYDEVEGVLKGLVTAEMLKRRYDGGVMIKVRNGNYSMHIGSEADSLRDDLNQKLRGEGDMTVLFGTVASQGYAKGVARVILSSADFKKFKEGEILVTGMTRPEFVPIMKMAAGIVTNEGGITCHAAIVSRELEKPCVIGTQIATETIKDGDIVEVRANHGSVRILTNS